MKSLRPRGAAGNAKLRDKRYKLLACGCCTVSDFRPKENLWLANLEIRTYLKMEAANEDTKTEAA